MSHQPFTDAKAPNETCPKCNAVYKVQAYKAPVKERDHFVCACGHVMRDARSTRTHDYQLIKAGTPPQPT